MGKKVYFPATFMWAKVREEDRDMGKNLEEGSDQRNKIEAEQGHYILHAVITPETKKQMIANGVPNKGMLMQLFKVDGEGNDYYKCVRKHFNPKLRNRETGEMGVVLGPPKVFKAVGGTLLVTPNGNTTFDNEDAELVEWDWEKDGLIGNGSTGVVKLDVWDGKIVTFEGMVVNTHEEFNPETSSSRF